MILMNKLVQVDGKVKMDTKYPAGFMDVITINRTDQNFRLLYDVKGRFTLLKISPEAAQYKLCKVVKTALGRGGVANIVTHDGRTIRFPDPEIKVGDTVKIDLARDCKKTIVEFYKFQIDALVMVVQGRNRGRVGRIRKIEKHPGAYNIAHVVDDKEHVFATRLNNVFVIGSNKSQVKLPAGNGVKLTVLEERKQKENRQKNRRY